MATTTTPKKPSTTGYNAKVGKSPSKPCQPHVPTPAEKEKRGTC